MRELPVGLSGICLELLRERSAPPSRSEGVCPDLTGLRGGLREMDLCGFICEGESEGEIEGTLESALDLGEAMFSK